MSLIKQVRLGQGPIPARLFQAQADVEAGFGPAATETPRPGSSKSPDKTNGKSNSKGAAKAAGDLIEGDAVQIADGDATESPAANDASICSDLV